MRVSIGRSWIERCVGDAREALARVAVAERDRLVGDVAAREHDGADAERGEVVQQQVVERRIREHHAELGHARGDAFGDLRRRRGAARARSAAAPRRAWRARPRRAGRAPRPPRRRVPSARTAGPRAACARAARAPRPRRRQRRPGGSRRCPSPRAPRRRPAGARRRATASPPPGRSSGSPSRSSSCARGPQAGQALGCAWKRRSPGSSYSVWQAAHIANPAIVVAGRSYGTPRTIVKRGPQFVQFTNG